MNLRKVVIGALLIVIGLPVALGLIAGVSFYALLTFYAPNRTNGTIVSSGKEREYLLYVPKSYDRTKPTPLVISLHAAMNWPSFQMKITQWNKMADEHGFIVVYPAGAGRGPRIWIDGKAGLAADVRFIADLIDKLRKTYNIDPSRIYANGLSQGGGVTFVLSCALSDRIAAVGAVAAAYELPGSWCKGGQPVPMIEFHGTADPVVAYMGGPSPISPIVFPSIPAWAENWARRNRCGAKPIESVVARDVTRLEYTNCADDATVVLYTLNGAGHQWPGARNPLPEWMLGPASNSIDATSLMWVFFREHPLRRK